VKKSASKGPPFPQNPPESIFFPNGQTYFFSQVLCWCVDVLMCWMLICASWFVDILMSICWCWYVDVLTMLLICWCWSVFDCVDVLMIVFGTGDTIFKKNHYIKRTWNKSKAGESSSPPITSICSFVSLKGADSKFTFPPGLKQDAEILNRTKKHNGFTEQFSVHN
jgi:hypothetical protein